MRTFEVTIPRVYVFKEGYGVEVTPIWSSAEDGPEYVVEIEVSIVPIREADVSIVGNVPCLPIPGSFNAYVPVENFEQLDDLATDDTHDLRSRWFETLKEAQDHADYTLKRWAHPQPWESFVAV